MAQTALRVLAHGMVLSLLALALSACGARTAAVRGQDFVYVTTPDIVLRTDLDAPKARQLAKDLQSIRDFFSHSLFACSQGVELPPVEVTALRHKADLEALSRAIIAGYFQPAPASWLSPTVVIGVTREHTETLEVFTHELTHRMVSLCFPRAPTWLNEGLAKFFETIRPLDHQRMALGEPAYGFGPFFEPGQVGRGFGGRSVVFVPQGGVPQLSELRSMAPREFYSSELVGRPHALRLYSNYAGAWSAVHLLNLGDPELHDRFQDYLYQLRSRDVPEPALWDRIFEGIDLDARLREYQDENQFPWIHVERPQQVHQPSFRAMGEAETHLHLAELFLRRGKREIYRDHLNLARWAGASPSDISLLRAVDGLGAGDLNLAREEAARAVAASPSSRRANHAYLRLNLKGGLHNERFAASRERLLEQAETAEDFAVSALVALLRGQPDEAKRLARLSTRRNRLCALCQYTLGYSHLVLDEASQGLRALRLALATLPHGGGEGEQELTRLIEQVTSAVRTRTAQTAPAAPDESPIRLMALEASLDEEAAESLNEAATPCIAALHDQNPEARGEVDVAFRVAPSGVVLEAWVQQTTLNHPPLEGCITAVVRGWTFEGSGTNVDRDIRHFFRVGEPQVRRKHTQEAAPPPGTTQAPTRR